MLDQKNTKKQGDVGLGAAIGYFVTKGYTVSVPLTDSQDYDLIVDDGLIKRVQVKTTKFKRRKHFYVSMTTKGGNRSGAGKIKNFDKTKVELVFILTSENEKYIIPVEAMTAKDSITIDERYDPYKI